MNLITPHEGGGDQGTSAQDSFTLNRIPPLHLHGCPGGLFTPSSFFLAVTVLDPTDVNSWSRPPTLRPSRSLTQRCFRPQPTPVSSSSPSACLSSTSAVHIPPHIPIRRLYSLGNGPSKHSPRPLRSPRGLIREGHPRSHSLDRYLLRTPCLNTVALEHLFKHVQSPSLRLL